MSASRSLYLDSSALVKLAVRETESEALRSYLRRRRNISSSALARTEVLRALLPAGAEAVRRGHEILRTVNLIRLSDQVLGLAGELRPSSLRSLDAIHLATAQLLEPDLAGLITYDERMTAAAVAAGFRVAGPA